MFNLPKNVFRSLLLAFCAVTTPALAATVVEFYNTNLDNYFITADANEAAAIDSGSAGPGWIRTGNTFTSGGSTYVCRFYGSQSPGPNSHFYTVDASECTGLRQLQANTPDTEKRWNFESMDFVSTPPTNGTCLAGTVPVYRAYNNGFSRGVDSNHRITSSSAAIQEVVNRGWSNEGVVMCAPCNGTTGVTCSGNLAGTHTASGTYTYASGTTNLNWTSSDFTCNGPSLGTETLTGVTVTSTTLTWSSDGDGMVWTRSSGTANDIVGTWTSTDSTTGNSWTLTFNANSTVSVVGSIVSCSGGSGGDTWTMTMNETAGSYIITPTLIMSGTSVSGTQPGESTAITGSVNGNNISLTIPLTDPNCGNVNRPLTLTGTVSGNTMSGTLSRAAGGSCIASGGTWSGAKQ